MEVDYTPTTEDWALHGREIQNTSYINLWRQTLGIISNYAGGAFYLGLRNSTIRFSLYRCPTACINLITKDIYINPTFIRVWDITAMDLAFLLMHEALHPILDPEKQDNVTIEYNICADALINSIIFRISPALSSFPRKVYSEEIFPNCILKSGVSKVWRKIINEKLELKGLEVPVQQIHLETYLNLYPNSRKITKVTRPSIESLISFFFDKEKMKERNTPIEITLEISGEEGDSSDGLGQPFKIKFAPKPGDEKNLSKEKKEAIEKIIEELNKKPIKAIKSIFSETNESASSKNLSSKGASKTGTLEEFWEEAAKKEEIFKTSSQITKEERIKWAYETVKGINPAYAKNAFGEKGDFIYDKIKKNEELYLNDGIVESFIISSQNDCRGELVDLLTYKKLSSRTVIPARPTRMGYSLLSQNFFPLFYKRERSVKEQQRKNTVVYVDFSGSMSSQIKWLLGLIPLLESRCNADIWVFSTEIVKSSVQEFKQGKYYSTGGTSFDTVIEHAVNQNPEAHNFLMITDGCDSVSEKASELLKSSGKTAYMLIVESHTPRKATVESHQKWCTRVFLKERKWWNELGLNPKERPLNV